MSLWRHPLLILGLLIKLGFLFVSSNGPMEQLFIPFIDEALLNPGQNPWVLKPPVFFPYGSFLFLCLYIPKWIGFQIFGDLALGSTGLSLFLMKAPLLIFDILLLQVLRLWSEAQNRSLLLFYWLNPILFYISYVHGQLDVVSTSLCIWSLWFLAQRKILFSALIFSLGLLSKFQIVCLVPFMMAYLWNHYFAKEALRKILFFSMTLISLTTVGFLPQLFAGQFDYVSTSSPEAFRIFSLQLNLGSDTILYLGLIFVSLVIGRLLLSTRITSMGLFFGAGLVMTSLLLVTNPGPGWYYWPMPFLSLFFASYVMVPRLLFVLLWFFYGVYFAVLSNEIPQLYRALSFTMLQTVLLTIFLALYLLCIRFESQLKFRLKPFLIGLSGDSGSGKNHLSNLLQDLFSPKKCLILEGDSYHLWERGHKKWETLTHLNPKANDLSRMEDHLSKMNQGLSIQHHQYDHSTGKFTDPILLQSARTVIFQGLHSLYLKKWKDQLPLKVFLNPSENVRLFWKLRRDVIERKHDPNHVLNSIEKRASDSKEHILPQMEKSDVIIEFQSDDKFQPENWKPDHPLNLYLQVTLPNDEPIQNLFHRLESAGLQIQSQPSERGIDWTRWRLIGKLDPSETAKIASDLYPELRQITRAHVAPRFYGNYDGILQLIFLSMMQKRIFFEELSY